MESFRLSEQLVNDLCLPKDVDVCSFLPFCFQGWLHVIETQDFLRMVFDGESKYAELILSPHINRVVATKDWMSFQSHVQKGSTRLASGRYVAKALVAITKLREEIRQEQKSEVQGVRPSFDAVIRWATIFR